MNDEGAERAFLEQMRRSANRMAVLSTAIGVTGVVFMMLGLRLIGAVMAGVSIAMCFGMPWALAALVVAMVVIGVTR